MRKNTFTFSTLFVLILAILVSSACSPTVPPGPTATQTGTVTAAIPSRRPTATIPVLPATETLTPIASPTIATPMPTSAPEHRIGVRAVDGEGEFYDRRTGEKFIPRGFNYVRLAPMAEIAPRLWHSTLNPGFYEPERAEVALRRIHDGGYNVVRIFVDCCRKGSNAGDPRGGISEAYLENVIDFLTKAKASEIYVLMIMDLTPAEGGYDEMWRQCCTTFDGENLRYLTVGGHTGERRFDRDFIRALIEKGAPMDAIFAYDLNNEVQFSPDQPPFSLNSGKVRTANQKTYDMAVPEDKQRMMDENLVYWIDSERASILEVDPTALVTASFTANRRIVNTQPAIFESTADFIDLHTYLGWGWRLDQYMRIYGVDEPPEKPIILGEFGAAKGAFPTAAMAGLALQDWQIASCDYGFDGWLLWTWDCDEQTDLWNGMSENGEISAALAPVNRPDPCSLGEAQP